MTAPRGRLSPEQVSVLLQPIKEFRVYQSQGHSHVAAFDITAHLTRMFGFDGWDKEILSLDVVRERMGHDTNESKKNWYVTYRCLLRLTIYSPDGRVAKIIEEGATGSAENQPSYGDAHDLAMKNAISYAMKRAAKDLGDQFGLALYNKGKTGALVKGIVPVSGPTDIDGDQIEGEGADPTSDRATEEGEAA